MNNSEKFVRPDQFDEFFQTLHGRPAYDWQIRLARLACEGRWPDRIDLPTGSGKTACIDVAVFAMAVQAYWNPRDRTAPPRLFYGVNRRVIVDEAHRRAFRIAKRLATATDGIVFDVASALRKLAGTENDESSPPLDVLELRGGIYKDDRWARSATQPTVVCSTIDQLGSRLLFRGYGVSPNAAPIHAALLAYDSLIVLDEAHISRPFQQTLRRVRDYLDPERWTLGGIRPRPFIFVPMTATPADDHASDEVVIALGPEDEANPALRNRLDAAKPTRLLAVPDVAAAAVEEAERLLELDRSPKSPKPLALGIIVNRVASAKAIHQKLNESYRDTGIRVDLVIGSMRPVDRDALAKSISASVGPDRPPVTTDPSIVVATQCLEVGADYDFDALISECASLDALRQRFGRLNRAGRSIQAEGVVLAREKDVASSDASDPIYGNALAATWNRLSELAETVEPAAVDPDAKPSKKKAKPPTAARVVDFGIRAMNRLLEQSGGSTRIPDELLAPSASLDAPILLPAYLDLLCQTCPIPDPDPEVALFIHGPQPVDLDVQVCWRADLDDASDDQLVEIVSLLPPTAAECMSVPISRLRRRLEADPAAPKADADGDLLERPVELEEKPSPKLRNVRNREVREIRGVIWRGAEDSLLLRSPNDIRPGDTVVFSTADEGWNDLGHVPAPSEIDVAETAFRAARGRIALRLRPAVHPELVEGAAAPLAELYRLCSDPDLRPRIADVRRLLREASDSVDQPLADTLRLLAVPANALQVEDYPDDLGAILSTRKRVVLDDDLILPPADDQADDSSRLENDREVSLADHTQHVVDELRALLARLPAVLPEDLYIRAAKWHDLGKADDRFQAWLAQTERGALGFDLLDSGDLLAKSVPGQSLAEILRARDLSGLPAGFRHEMLSVQLAQPHLEAELDNPDDRDLVLHLIAAHHGRARPFAPVVIDLDPPDVDFTHDSTRFQLSGKDRKALPPHRIDSGIPERFWNLVRRHGWWGIAYAETILLLADRRASMLEGAGAYESSSQRSNPTGARA